MFLTLLAIAPQGFASSDEVSAVPLPKTVVVRPLDVTAREEGLKLRVQVVDDRGIPVPTATVRIDDENLRHRVHPRTGRWHGRSTYPDDRHPEAFREGREVSLTVAAPGYLPRTVRYRVRHARNLVEIPMEPLDGGRRADAPPTLDLGALLAVGRLDCEPARAATPFRPAIDRGPVALDPSSLGRLADLEEPDPWLTASFSNLLLSQGPERVDDALAWADIAMAEAHTTTGDDYVGLVHDLYRVRALAHHVRWQQWELTSLADPTRRNRGEAEKARVQAARVASEWVQWADAAGQGTDLPAALCMASSDRPLDCTP